MFLRLFPISPLSTGLSTYFSLLRLTQEVHCSWVIGTEVPASPEGRQRQDGAEVDGRTDLRRQAMRCSSERFGASREEAPEELIFPLARRGSEVFGRKDKAGRQSGQPKKGRGTSDGFDLRVRRDD
jgi:hypothetical protein